jgi:hypothetical protein
MKITFPLYLIAIGVVCIGLQNAGIIRPYKISKTKIDGIVGVEGSYRGEEIKVKVENFNEILRGEIDVNVKNFWDIDYGTIDVNINSSDEIPVRIMR